MAVVRLSALRTGHLLPPIKGSWYSFLLQAESIQGPQCDRKDSVNQCFTSVGYATPHISYTALIKDSFTEGKEKST
jgi:hypothetical protein